MLDWFRTEEIGDWSRQIIRLLFTCLDGTVSVHDPRNSPLSEQGFKEAHF